MLKLIGSKTIETDNLILRRFAKSDIPCMQKNWISDSDIQSLYCEPTYTTNQEINDLLDIYISAYENPNYYRWAIISKKNSECIGQIAYFLVNEKNHFAELEYCIGKSFQNKGYATEAAKAVISFGFNDINLHKVQISHKSNNPKSKKVIEKCGLKYEATFKDYFYNDGKYIDRLYYSIFKAEFFSK